MSAPSTGSSSGAPRHFTPSHCQVNLAKGSSGLSARCFLDIRPSKIHSSGLFPTLSIRGPVSGSWRRSG